MSTFLTKHVVKDLGKVATVIYILNDNHQLVGDAELSFDNPNNARIDDIYIYRAYRGKGYGVALLGEICEEAKRKGAVILRCHPSPYERGPDEIIKEPQPGCISEAELVTWYVVQGFTKLNLSLKSDFAEFEQYCCELYIAL